MNTETGIRGIAHGKTIELEQDSGLPEGQSVVVVMRPIQAPEDLTERLKRSFGAWADDSEGLDEYLEWNRQQRKKSRPEIEE
jgi:hypothetical protein